MTVETKHPQYDEMYPEWKLVKALTAGQRQVKSPEIVKMILPDPDEKDEKRIAHWVDRRRCS